MFEWALQQCTACDSLTRRYLPSNPHNNWLYAAAATKKKRTSQQNPFAHHQCSVKVSDNVSLQDKIGLHQFDDYLCQVKINVTTTAISCHTQDIWRVFHLSAGSAQTHWAREAISFLACNVAKCWLILKFFYKQTQQWICSKFSLKMPQYLKYLAAVPYDL